LIFQDEGDIVECSFGLKGRNKKRGAIEYGETKE
jgi:hypothetical protein